MIKKFIFYPSIIGFFVIIFLLSGSKQLIQAVCTGKTQCYYTACFWSNKLSKSCPKQGDTDIVLGTCECSEQEGPSVSCSSCGSGLGCYEFCGTIGTPVQVGKSGCERVVSTCWWAPICGDGLCTAGENCSNCSADCKTGCDACGDGSCNAAAGENACTCSTDCPGSCDTGGSCSGSCMSIAANCGVYNMDPGSGSCGTNEMCCQSKGGDATEDCNCCPVEAWVEAQTDGEWKDCDKLVANGGPNLWPKGWAAARRGECTDRCPVCEPACTPACGQNDGCGKRCSSADDGNPTCPTLTSTTPRLNSTTGKVTISWNSVAKADQYNVNVYPKGTKAGCPPVNPDAYCATGQTSTSFSFFPNANYGNNYVARIQPINTSCGIDARSWCYRPFQVYARIRSKFYEDFDGSCSAINLVVPGDTSRNRRKGKITVSNGRNFNLTERIESSVINIWAPYRSLGNYSVTLDPGQYNDGTWKDWSCVCPENCSYDGINAPDGPLKFYVSRYDLTHGGWFQTLGGHIFAAQDWPSLAINDPIPVSTCEEDPACKSVMIARDLDDNSKSAGFVITGGGLVDSSDEDGEQANYLIERPDNPARVLGSNLEKVTENYSFFANKLNINNAAIEYEDNPNNASKPKGLNLENEQAYLINGDMTIKKQWLVPAGETIVIFVDGNLYVEDPTDSIGRVIGVEEGGFLAFIVSGDISFGKRVGNDIVIGNPAADDLTPNVEGIFVADGSIDVENWEEISGGDDKFIGAGIFVGWGGVNLNRDFSDASIRKAENNIRPAELFIYRPDLVVNAPESMAEPRLLWQESN